MLQPSRCVLRSKSKGITIVRWDELSDDERDRPQRQTFTSRLFGVLTPLAVDPGHPFPYISGLSSNLAVSCWSTRARARARPGQGAAGAAAPSRIEPGLDESPLADMYDTRFVPLEDVISATWTTSSPGWRSASTSPSG